jgi:PhnB protein
MQVQPYLFFDGRCEEALDFYKKAVGAQVEMLMRFKEAPPNPNADPNACGGAMPGPDKVMHCSFKVGDTSIMASDGNCMGHPDFKGFSLTINAKDDAEAKRLFGALSDGGQVQMPMAETFFATSFGMVADKFGVGWMVIAAKQ